MLTISRIAKLYVADFPSVTHRRCKWSDIMKQNNDEVMNNGSVWGEQSPVLLHICLLVARNEHIHICPNSSSEHDQARWIIKIDIRKGEDETGLWQLECIRWPAWFDERHDRLFYGGDLYHGETGTLPYSNDKILHHWSRGECPSWHVVSVSPRHLLVVMAQGNSNACTQWQQWVWISNKLGFIPGKNENHQPAQSAGGPSLVPTAGILSEPLPRMFCLLMSTGPSFSGHDFHS